MYCEIGDVRSRVPEATNSYVSDTTVAGFIVKQSGKIDDWLRKLYTVPFSTPVPSTIVDLCTDMSVYKVMQTFPDQNFDEDLERLGREIMQTIADIRKGDITLDAEEVSTGSTVSPYFKFITVTVDE